MREFHCKDVGMPDCHFVAKGKDDEEVMRKAAETEPSKR
jgi:predicted small metal-binding protein